jgi:hypothetical protein
MVDEKKSGKVSGVADPAAATGEAAVADGGSGGEGRACSKCGVELRAGDEVLHCAEAGCPLGGVEAVRGSVFLAPRGVSELQAEARAETERMRAGR